MDTLATSILGTFQADFKSMMNTLCTIDSCETGYQSGPDSVIPGLSVNVVDGTRAGETGPASACGVINWHTDFDHYRGGHARSYITGPVINDFQTVSIFTAAYISALTAKATSFRGAVDAYAGAPFTALTLARLARIRDKQPLDPPVLRAIVGESVRSVIGQQRRRLT